MHINVHIVHCLCKFTKSGHSLFLQTMKIVLVVVILVACFAAVNCQSISCVTNEISNNGNLLCATMLAVSLLIYIC